MTTHITPTQAREALTDIALAALVNTISADSDAPKAAEVNKCENTLTTFIQQYEQMEAALSLNSPLMSEIDQIVIRDAVTFANARDAGASASMNGALDYTSLSIVDAVRRHLGMTAMRAAAAKKGNGQ